MLGMWPIAINNKRAAVNGLRMLLMLFVLMASTSLNAQVLRMAANVWPPYTDQRLPEDGLSVDLIRTALGRAGYQVEYVEVPWERALQGLRQGRYDLINDWTTTTHAAYARYGRAFLTNRVRWVQRRGEHFRYEGRGSLIPYRIVLSRGYVYSDELATDSRLNKGYAANFVQAARMLLAGRADLTLEDEQTARFHFGRELSDVENLLQFVPGEFANLDLSLVVRNDHPQQAQIIAAFDREIEAMLADGSYAAIFLRHGLPAPQRLP